MTSGAGMTGANIDVTIHIKGDDATRPEAVIDSNLVRFLSLVQETGSVNEACDRIGYSPRKTQRMLKRFTDATGLRLLCHHGWVGTELTPSALQCITLYRAALKSVQRVVQERGFAGGVPFELCASIEDGSLRLATDQFKGHSRDPTD